MCFSDVAGSMLSSITRSSLSLSSLDPKDRVVGRIGQGLELAPDLSPPTLEVGLYHSGLLFVRHLHRSEGLGTPAILELATTRRAQVANPVRLAARGHEVALAVQLEDVDRHAAPAPRFAALYPKGRHSTEPHQEGICYPTDQPAWFEITPLLHIVAPFRLPCFASRPPAPRPSVRSPASAHLR